MSNNSLIKSTMSKIEHYYDELQEKMMQHATDASEVILERNKYLLNNFDEIFFSDPEFAHKLTSASPYTKQAKNGTAVCTFWKAVMFLNDYVNDDGYDYSFLCQEVIDLANQDVSISNIVNYIKYKARWEKALEEGDRIKMDQLNKLILTCIKAFKRTKATVKEKELQQARTRKIRTYTLER